MGIFKCDWKECRHKPYAEIFYNDEEESKWCYLCFWHFIYARLRRDKIGWCKVDTDREMLEQIREEIWELQSDLMDIKKKLKIKEKKVQLTPVEKLWDNKEDECWNECDCHDKKTKPPKKNDNKWGPEVA
jgi:hypothetical protein